MDQVTPDPGAELTIGQFARQAGVTPKALRLYDEMGLLRPLAVDPTNSYRRYGPQQLRPARLIGLLRGAGFSLADIGLFLIALDAGTECAGEELDRLLRELERAHTSRRFLVRHVHAVLREEDPVPFTIHTRPVPAQRVLSMARRLRAPETDAFVLEARAAFAAHLGDAAPTGPFMLLFHGIVDHESDGPIEAVQPCTDDVPPSEAVGIRTEPAHDEAYTTVTKAEWAYPAILAAYDAVACSPAALARPPGRLSCREVYRAAPDDIGDDDLICDIAFPLG
jgi:DNA-binding transcriptional MerR regulator